MLSGTVWKKSAILAATCVGAILLLASPVAAPGAVRVGSDLHEPPSSSDPNGRDGEGAGRCPFLPCTALQERIYGIPNEAPEDGVVTHLRIRSLDPYPRFYLNVLRPEGPASLPTGWNVVMAGAYSYDNVARVAFSVKGGVTDVPVRIPVRRGDHFGIEMPALPGYGPNQTPRFLRELGGQNGDDGGVPGYTVGLAIPDNPPAFQPPDNGGGNQGSGGDGGDFEKLFGHPATHPLNTLHRYGLIDAGIELLYNVSIEPDADHDGYGDEVQDNCPEVPNPSQARRNRFTPRLGDACGPHARLRGIHAGRLVVRHPGAAIVLRGRARAPRFGLRAVEAAVIGPGCRDFTTHLRRNAAGSKRGTCGHPHFKRLRGGKHFKVRLFDLPNHRYKVLVRAVDRRGNRERLIRRKLGNRVTLALR